MGKKNYEKGKFTHGVIELNVKDLDVCPTIDLLGECCIVDCLKCDNCTHNIVIATGKVSSNFANTEKYIIEFFDKVDTNDIIGYLDDDNSDYRITREKDGIILRYSKADLIEYDNEYNCMRKEVLRRRNVSYDGFIFDYNEELAEEKPKSFIKRIISKVSNKTLR